MKQVVLIIDPRDYLSLDTYQHLKQYMDYPKAIKILFSAMEYYLYVGEEYLYELDTMLYDELGYIQRDTLAMDIVAATFNVIAMKYAPKYRLLLDPYLRQQLGKIDSVTAISPTCYHVAVEINAPTAGEYHETPAFITQLIKQRLQEVILENDAFYHRDICCLIAGIKPIK